MRHIAAAIAPYAYNRIYTAWFDRTMLADAQAGMARSVERYLMAIQRTKDPAPDIAQQYATRHLVGGAGVLGSGQL